MPVIDAQVHIWEANSRHRPWVSELAQFVPQAHYTADELLADMDSVGTDATVVVPPHWDAYRNDLAIDAARRFPDRFAAMFLPNLDSNGVRDELDRALDDPAVKGVRVAFWDGPSSAGFERGEYEWLWSYLERRATPTAMYVPLHLDQAERIARRHPDLRIALCHLAMYHRQRVPSISALTNRLLQFAGLPNVSLKATALPTPSVEPSPYGDLRESFERLFDGFGPERMFWGTDITRLVRDGYSYSDSLQFMANLSFLDDPSRELLMGRAIQQWLGWPEAGLTKPQAACPARARA